MADMRHTFLPAPHRMLDPEAIASLVQRLDRIDSKGAISQKTKGEVFALPFYPGLDLIRLTDPDWAPLGVCVYFIQRDGELYRLNGTSPPIHEVNAKNSLRLTEAVVGDYLRFFCFFVRGEDGPFLICEDPADPLIPTDAPGIAEYAEPPRLFGVDEEGKFRLSATVLYGDGLFTADFLVDPTGMVRMVNDDKVMSDLPSKISAPLVLEDNLSVS